LALRGREGQGGVRNGADAGLITTDAARAVAGPGAAAANVYADDDSDQADALAEVLAEIDAVLARSSRLRAGENLAPRAADDPDVDTTGQGTNARRPCRTVSGC
jgi:hypothetical protein